MTNPTKTIPLMLLASLVLGLGACAGDEAAEPTGAATSEAMSDDMGDMSEGHDDTGDDHAEFAFGEPGDAADADRTIEIEATSPFTFEPGEVTVAAGETVTFEITNSDSIVHDFTLGGQEAQDEHEAEMREMEEMDGEMEHADANAITLPAGETTIVTWTFTEPGTVMYGCHQPGHYDAGMHGDITVEG